VSRVGGFFFVRLLAAASRDPERCYDGIGLRAALEAVGAAAVVGSAFLRAGAAASRGRDFFVLGIELAVWLRSI
jgi:hypothetical protein